MDVQFVMFWVFAVVGLFSALMVVTRRNPVHSVLYLLVTFFSVAAIYVVLQAEFIAVVQILVYAGGILVLFLFVIFLVDVRREPGLRRMGAGHLMLAIALCFVVAFAVNRLFFGVLFFGSLWGLVVVTAVVFVLLRLTLGRVAR